MTNPSNVFHRSGAGHRAGLPDSDGAVHFVHRPADHPGCYPSRLAGVVFILWLTHSTFNIMSLMGVIHDDWNRSFQQHLDRGVCPQLRKEDFTLQDALVRACKIRLRPILMTSLATLLGMLPMALGIETGSDNMLLWPARDRRLAVSSRRYRFPRACGLCDGSRERYR